MSPFVLINTPPEPSLSASIPAPPEDAMEEAFSSVMLIPPLESTIRAGSTAVDRPNPDCVTTVIGEDEIYTDRSLPGPAEAPEQVQLPEAGGVSTQLPASDGDDQTKSDANTAAETAGKADRDSAKLASQGAIPPTMPLYLPTRPPRMSTLRAFRFASKVPKEFSGPCDGRFTKDAVGAIIHSPPLAS